MGCKERPQREQNFQNVLGVIGDNCLSFACFSLVARVIWCCFGLTAIGTRVNSSRYIIFMVCVLFGDVCTWSCATGCSPLSSRSRIQVLTTPIALFGCTSSWSKWSSKTLDQMNSSFFLVFFLSLDFVFPLVGVLSVSVSVLVLFLLLLLVSSTLVSSHGYKKSQLNLYGQLSVFRLL